eukprot:856136-Alexandrium_andersonii.AAC.1
MPRKMTLLIPWKAQRAMFSEIASRTPLAREGGTHEEHHELFRCVPEAAASDAHRVVHAVAKPELGKGQRGRSSAGRVTPRSGLTRWATPLRTATAN